MRLPGDRLPDDFLFDGFKNLAGQPAATDSERVCVYRVSRPFAELARIFVAVGAADAEVENQLRDGVDLSVGHTSVGVGIRPSGVYLSIALGRLVDSLETSSSRVKPVCRDKVSSTSGPMACSN